MKFDFCLMHLWMHEIFYWIWILKIHIWMHEIWFFLFFFYGAFMNVWNFLLNLNFEFEWKCMFEYIKFDFFVLLEECIWMHESLIEYEFLISMKMHVWVYEIWFFYSFWRMHIWMLQTLWIFWMKMHAWMHKFFLSFWFFFLKNAYMNAWNFVNFQNEIACFNT